MAISQITSNSIEAGAVSASDLADGSISTAKIADANVTAIKLAAGAARANFGAGAVLQVAQAVLTTTFFTNSNGTFVDVTNLSVTITPASSSSKFLLLGSVVYGAEYNANPCLRFSGGNATNYVGDARGSRRRVAWSGGDDYFNGTSSTVANQITFTAQMTYLDSPATSSAITYKIQAMSDVNGGMYVNRCPDDIDSSGEGYTAASSLLVLEIAG